MLELSGFILKPGAVSIAVPLAVDLSEDKVAEPVSLPLDVYYGVTEDLTVGVTHSNGVVQPVSPYQPGSGICFTPDSGCNEVYDNVGLDSLYRIVADNILLAWHGGVGFSSFDPARSYVRLGALFEAPLARQLALIADPRILIGLTNRSDDNEQYATLPIGIQYWANENLRLAVRTSFGGPLDNFSDAYTGSLGGYAGYSVNKTIGIFAAFDFLNLYGAQANTENRSLGVGANISL